MMFDTSVQVTSYNSMKFNSVGGTLVKSHPLSKMIRMHMNSSRAKEMFGFYSMYERIPVVILQTMLCGDQEFLVEFITKKDYEGET